MPTYLVRFKSGCYPHRITADNKTEALQKACIIEKEKDDKYYSRFSIPVNRIRKTAKDYQSLFSTIEIIN